jgi:hypothetical protein
MPIDPYKCARDFACRYHSPKNSHSEDALRRELESALALWFRLARDDERERIVKRFATLVEPTP